MRAVAIVLLGTLVACAPGIALPGTVSVRDFTPRVSRVPPPVSRLRLVVGPAVFGADYTEPIRPSYPVQLAAQLRAAGFAVVEPEEPHDLVVKFVGASNEEADLRLETPDGAPVDTLAYRLSGLGFANADQLGMTAADWYDHLAGYVVEHLVNQLGASQKLSAFARDPSRAATLTSPSPSTSPSPFLPATPQPASFALVIGIDRYRDAPAAPGARADAEHFADLARRTLGLRPDHLRVAIEDRATRTDVMEGLKWLADVVPAGGRAYFFFSGHGAPSTDGSTYLVPYDADPKDLAGTGVSMNEVTRSLASLRAKEVLALVDACFSGAGGRSLLPTGARPLLRVKEAAPAARLALFTASQPDEISGLAPGENAGVFTKYLTLGLGTGQADVDGDGQVTLQELADWVSPRVARDAKEDKREQHPKLALGTGLGSAGQFVVEYGVSPR
jgi:Caspase domain